MVYCILYTVPLYSVILGLVAPVIYPGTWAAPAKSHFFWGLGEGFKVVTIIPLLGHSSKADLAGQRI